MSFSNTFASKDHTSSNAAWLLIIACISGGTILAVLYGIDVDNYSAERMESIEKAIEIITEIADGGLYLGTLAHLSENTVCSCCYRQLTSCRSVSYSLFPV